MCVCVPWFISNLKYFSASWCVVALLTQPVETTHCDYRCLSPLESLVGALDSTHQTQLPRVTWTSCAFWVAPSQKAGRTPTFPLFKTNCNLPMLPLSLCSPVHVWVHVFVEVRGQPWLSPLRYHLPCVLRRGVSLLTGTCWLGQVGWPMDPDLTASAR